MIKPEKWTEHSDKVFRNEGMRKFSRYQWFLDHMTPPADLLEIGFCSGDALSWYADMGFKCTGIDLPKNVEQATDSRIEYIIQNMDNCNGGELASMFFNKFDYVICAEVLQHLLFDENCLYAIWHYLKPGGKLLLSTECKKLQEHAFRYYDVQGLIRTLETLQFKMEDFTTQGQPGCVWVCARKII